MPTNSCEKTTVLLADHHPLALAGIRKLLAKANDLEIIGEADDGFKAQKLLVELHPKILLIDLKMPGPRPSDLEKWLRKNCLEIVTLVLTADDRDAYLAGMIDAGASGYLSKNITSKQLIAAIRRAALGEIIFDKIQLTRASQWQEAVGKKIRQLTHREHDILILLAKGMDSKSISVSLKISTKTVAYHITNVFSKLDVNSRQQAAIWALKHLSDDLDMFLG